ncbi:MAG: UvrD-helicase domain-containing protein [Sinobacteraceae bacterium]|nr:UvrD-helicase domain-containing protein [Nevskiaceae bacterium]MCP5339175.1 UvrD-helicase domain-containing protein [Nevskiaceae bacterium]MCP5360453.1 UvrD-helicase domain-containing protein [Nevskiaceae bacterium]MCP5467014.1 UvrD-helicase domain-containing protein [Nevskiaceae bacterium]
MPTDTADAGRPPQAADDAAARAAALDPARSILLQAPAGSGKTTLLTQRFLRLLAVVDAPEQILAVTFTRKAAAEMRTRIVGALRACRAAPATAAGGLETLTASLAAAALERSQQRGWDIETNPARLRIQTLDGLNRALAASLPIAAAAGQSLELTQREREIYREAARRTLLDAEAEVALQEHSDRLLRRLDNRWLRLEELLAGMLARRSHWLRHVAGTHPLDLQRRVEHTLDRIAAEALRDVHRHWPQALRAEGLRLAAHALRNTDPELAARLEALGDPGAEPAQLPYWQALAGVALTVDNELRKKLDARNGFPAADKPMYGRANDWLAELRSRPAAVAALSAVPKLPPLRFETTDAAVLGSLIVLLRYAAGQLELLFRDLRRVDYVAIAAAARTALAEDEAGTELTIHQGEQLAHLLVDEFQDTSLDQFELLEALTRDWVPGDGRSLFLVGDPMQSIYQFREAEVGLFLRARDSGIGRLRLESLALTRNFRSAPQVVGFVNRVFATIFPAADDPREAAVRYLACEAAGRREPAVMPRVQLRHLPRFDTQGEADAVLAIVRALREESPTATLAVLVAARDHAATLARTLRAADIAVQGVDLIPLDEVPAVQDLIALTRALLDPTDRTAWIAVLRAPWCGLELRPLTALFEDAPRATLAEVLQQPARLAALPVAARARLQHVHEACQAAREQLGRVPLAAVVEATWLRLGGAVVYLQDSAVLDARRFLDALAEREQSGEWTGAEDLGPLVARLFAASDTVAGNAVQVMTIHRAKGLEFDAVILPSLGRVPRSGEEPLLNYLEWPDRDGQPQLLLAPIRAPESDEPAPLGAWIRALQKCRRERERVRLLYVAATRARAALYLLGSLDAERGGPPLPQAGSPLASLWPAIAAEFPPDAEPGSEAAAMLAAETPLQTPASLSSASATLRRAVQPWSVPALPPVVAASATLPVATAELPEAGAALSGAAVMSRRLGQVVYAELQRLAAERRSGGPADPATIDRARCQRLLAAQGLPASQLEAAGHEVEQALARVLADPQGRWLLDPAHREARSALGLSGLYTGRFTNVRVDRSFVDAQGQRWLIDYGLSRPEDRLAGQQDTLEAWVAAELRRLGPSLRRAATLAHALGPEPLRLAIYFPLLPRFEEIPGTD